MRIDNEIYFALVEERLAAGERVIVSLVGSSMQPTLVEGDKLLLEKAVELKVGDVVLFRHRGRHLLHRIVAIEGDCYTMRGDNCVTNEVARREDVVAKLVGVEKRNRMRHFLVRWFGHKGRRQLRPWYFLGLAVLMWAPLNGMDIPLDNYLLGLRLDHLLHASVFIPCTLFLWDLYGVGKRKWAVWPTAVAVGIVTETVQWLLPYRGFDINDMVANFLGVTLGWLLIVAVRRATRRRRQCPALARRGECK